MNKTIVWPALAAGFVRLLLGFGLMLMAVFWPESHMAAMLDFPTVGLYFALGAAGVPVAVRNAFDPIFLLAGVTLWAFLGGTIGFSARHLGWTEGGTGRTT